MSCTYSPRCSITGRFVRCQANSRKERDTQRPGCAATHRSQVDFKNPQQGALFPVLPPNVALSQCLLAISLFRDRITSTQGSRYLRLTGRSSVRKARQTLLRSLTEAPILCGSDEAEAFSSSFGRIVAALFVRNPGKAVHPRRPRPAPSARGNTAAVQQCNYDG